MLKKLLNSRGSAILIVLALISMLTAVAIMSVDRSTTDIDLSYNQLHEEQAFYTAEAGVASAIVELNKDFVWRGPLIDNNFSTGTFAVILLDSAWNPALVDTVIIRSTARHTGSAVNLEAWVKPERYKPFEYGVFAGTSLFMKRNTCSDSYNSDSGTYAETVTMDGGNLGSNGTVTIEDGSVVGGDVTSATPGGLNIGSGATIMGDTSSTADSAVFETIPESQYVWANSVNEAPAGLSGSGYTYDPVTKSLKVASDGNVTLQSGVYYMSDLTLQERASLKLAPGADVTIYVTGNIMVQKEGAVNSGGSPSDLQIYSKGNLFSIHKQAEFYGAFYGPYTSFALDTTNVDLTWIGKNSEIYGSIVGNKIIVNKQTCFHYDRSLSKLRIGPVREMKIVARREI